jgi:hypothetical protein
MMAYASLFPSGIDFLARNPSPILFLIMIISIICGWFLFFRPARAIEIQRRFYARINWRIEPISIPKEIRNTRLMGFFLILLAFLTLALSLIKS